MEDYCQDNMKPRVDDGDFPRQVRSNCCTIWLCTSAVVTSSLFEFYWNFETCCLLSLLAFVFYDYALKVESAKSSMIITHPLFRQMTVFSFLIGIGGIACLVQAGLHLLAQIFNYRLLQQPDDGRTGSPVDINFSIKSVGWMLVELCSLLPNLGISFACLNLLKILRQSQAQRTTYSHLVTWQLTKQLEKRHIVLSYEDETSSSFAESIFTALQSRNIPCWTSTFLYGRRLLSDETGYEFKHKSPRSMVDYDEIHVWRPRSFRTKYSTRNQSLKLWIHDIMDVEVSKLSSLLGRWLTKSRMLLTRILNWGNLTSLNSTNSGSMRDDTTTTFTMLPEWKKFFIWNMERRKVLEEAMGRATHFVFLVNHAWFESAKCQLEYRIAQEVHAKSTQLEMIPIMLPDALDRPEQLTRKSKLVFSDMLAKYKCLDINELTSEGILERVMTRALETYSMS